MKTVAKGAFNWLTLSLCHASFIAGMSLVTVCLPHGLARAALLLAIILALVLVIWFRNHLWVYVVGATYGYGLACFFVVSALGVPGGAPGLAFFLFMLLLNVLVVGAAAFVIAAIEAGILLAGDHVDRQTLKTANIVGGSLLVALLLVGLLAIRPTENALIRAVVEKDAAAAERFIWFGVSPNAFSMWRPWSGPPQRTQTALAMAAFNGDDEMVKMLLKHGADPSLASGSGYNPLHDAACSGKSSTVKLLLNAGADWHGNSGVSALRIAASKGNVEMVNLLLMAGVPVDGSALVSAASGGNTDVARRLLDRGATSSIEDGTALCAAAEWGNTAMIDLLLDAGTSLERYGDAALQKAIEHLRAAAVDHLLRRGAKPQERGAVERARRCFEERAESARHLERYSDDNKLNVQSHVRLARRILELVEAASKEDHR
jgi:Ankyrin repeats (3 copies)